jgi:chitinase
MKKFLSLSLWTVLGLLTHIHALIENQFGQYPDICPELCYSAGPEPANWQQYHNVEDLSDCNQDLIFDFNVQGLLNNHEIHKTFRACAFASKEISIPPLNWTRSAYPKGANAVVSRQAYNGSSSNDLDCGAMTEPVTVTPSIGQLGIIQSSLDADEVASAASHLSAYLNNGASCDTTILFAKSGDSIVGLYSGADIENSGAASIIQDFHHHVGRGSPALQICDTSIDTDRTFGLFASRLDKLFQVQEAVRNWTNSFCLESLENSRPLEATQLNIFPSAKKISPGKFNSTTNVNNTSLNTTSLVRRDDCKPIQVVSGDDCGKLATRCGVSGNDFEQYNSGVPNLCSSLKAKEWLCCSPGTLNPPYLGPNPNPDGSCFTYTVQPKDGCFAIADAHQITQDDIENFNKNTWGWGSCDPTALQAGQVICLSKGSPPMPAPVPNTQCGPQVPGTQKPSDMTTLPDLNTCPLNACCDVWGFCGTTAEFCTPTPSKTGAPGSAQPGTNSCISNCGTDIINNQNAPAAFAQVGYFEAWNQNRRCLTMDVDQIPKGFTHIHFSFASLTSNFQINITGIEDQLSKFVKITGYRKVLSFGGWDFSTMPATYQIFRDATKPENRDTFANNIIAFLKQNQLDGVDFDWEYPGV